MRGHLVRLSVMNLKTEAWLEAFFPAHLSNAQVWADSDKRKEISGPLNSWASPLSGKCAILRVSIRKSDFGSARRGV